jgi:hypothetical protein
MGERIKKLIVDSRYRHTGTTADFSIELPDYQSFPSDWCCWVNSVSFPHSWFNVNGNNQTAYLLERVSAGGTVYRRGVQLTAQNYTLAELAAALELQLNATSNAPAYTVAAAGETLLISASGGEFQIPSRNELQNPQWKASVWDVAVYALGPLSQYSTGDPRALNDILAVPLQSSWRSSLVTGVIDLAANHSVYLHSNLHNYSTLDPIGRKTVMCRIPVEVAYGFTVQFSHSGLEADCLDVSNLKFRNASFSIRNVYGQVVDLRGGHVSIELVFGPGK